MKIKGFELIREIDLAEEFYYDKVIGHQNNEIHICEFTRRNSKEDFSDLTLSKKVGGKLCKFEQEFKEIFNSLKEDYKSVEVVETKGIEAIRVSR